MVRRNSSARSLMVRFATNTARSTHNGLYHKLDHLDHTTCRYEMLCTICIIQIQPMKGVLLIYPADYVASTAQQDPAHYRSGIYAVPALKDLDHWVAFVNTSVMCATLRTHSGPV